MSMPYVGQTGTGFFRLCFSAVTAVGTRSGTHFPNTEVAIRKLTEKLHKIVGFFFFFFFPPEEEHKDLNSREFLHLTPH